jgi:hypothetical protein
VHRYALGFVCAAIVACSDSGSPPADSVELSTDAQSYEVISGVPLSLTITLRNNGTSSISATLCTIGGVTTSEMNYQMRHGVQWVDIPYGQVDCGEVGEAHLMGPGDFLFLPAPVGPPDVAGTYRILVPWSTDGSSTTTTALSNPFVVISNHEPTSNQAPR